MARKDDQQTNVRLPAALKERINAAADEAGRSFTAEVVRRLEASFESVLEATLLQARLAERGELLVAQMHNEERLEELRGALAEYTATQAPGEFAAMHIDHIHKERAQLENQQERIAEYLQRNAADLKSLSDNLQDHLNQLERQHF